jgi:plastocyanin
VIGQSEKHVIETRAPIAVALAFVCTVGTTIAMLPQADAATHTVVMEGVAFKPQTLTVHRGDKVVWVNKDLFPHTATAQDRSFDSGELAPEKSWTLTAAKTGTFAYVCTLHPTMKGTVIVK